MGGRCQGRGDMSPLSNLVDNSIYLEEGNIGDIFPPSFTV